MRHKALSIVDLRNLALLLIDPFQLLIPLIVFFIGTHWSTGGPIIIYNQQLSCLGSTLWLREVLQHLHFKILTWIASGVYSVVCQVHSPVPMKIFPSREVLKNLV